MERAGPTGKSRGCLFCKSGKEADVIDRFRTNFPTGEAIYPTRTRIRRVHDAAIEERVPLLPGYVFFQIAEQEPEATGVADAILVALLGFSRIDSVLKLLRYSDGTWRLFGPDDEFAEMLFKSGGNIGLSTAYFDKGNRIKILDGFLKDYEGYITNVNRKKKTVEVTVNLQGKRAIMWLGYELVEAVPDNLSKDK
jgi:transcription antitermination factor NusG